MSSVRYVWTAITSKYAHQSAAITTMPRIAADTGPNVSRTSSAPNPIAKTDSPNAMMTIRPYRSVKWAGEMCQPCP